MAKTKSGRIMDLRKELFSKHNHKVAGFWSLLQI